MKQVIHDTTGQDIVLPQPNKLMRHLLLVGAGVAVLAALLGVGLPVINTLLQTSISVSRQQIQIATVYRGDLQHNIAAQGRIVAANSPTVYAPATGIITPHIKAGDAVENGQVIATIDSPELDSQLEQELTVMESLKLELGRQEIQTKTRLLNDEQAIENAIVDLELSEKKMQRAEQIYASRTISEADYELIAAELKKAQLTHKHVSENLALQRENLEFELQTKRLQLERQRFVVKELQRRVDELTLRSPITGIVGSITVRDRDSVSMNSPLFTLVDLTAFEVEVDIPEIYADNMSVGLDAEILLNSKSYGGKLTAISPEVVSGQVVGRIAFTTAPDNLRQNQRISARILIESRTAVLLVKRGSFVESGGGNTAYVVSGNTARRRSIEVGARGVTDVEIINGLVEGEEIIISDVERFNRVEQLFIAD